MVSTVHRIDAALRNLGVDSKVRIDGHTGKLFISDKRVQLDIRGEGISGTVNGQEFSGDGPIEFAQSIAKSL